MKINAQKFPETLLAISISIALTSTAAANNNITPPAGINDTVIINDGKTITLSTTENTDPAWDNFRSLWVGDNSDGSLLIDGRDIATAAGMIGNAANGSVTLTNGATWTLGNLNLVLGTHDGSGTLLVSNGSKISGIDELRIGEYAANAQGTVTIDGANSSVSSVWSVVGDQGRGNLVITRGGSLSLSEHMNIGYVGNTSSTSRNGYGVTLVDGENSLLDVTEGIYLGGFATTPNDATGILTVSNGATVRSGSLIWLAVGEGSTGILNIGGAKGEAQQAAGTLDLPWIYLGNTSGMNTAELNFNHNSDDFVLSAKITGIGEVNHVGSGTTTLTGANTYQGLTHVANGTLRAGVENTLSARSDYRVDSGAQLDLNGYSQTLNSLELAGTATLSSPSQVKAAFTPTTMTINGDYTGNNGLLALQTVLGDDSSATDKLVVKGDTSGTTRVSVSNAGGNGAQTVEGIQIVEVEGTSNGTFVKEGRIVAGAYDYSIVKSNNQNWVLTSQASVTPPSPVTPGEPEPPVPPAPEGPSQYRPESGSYLANILAANTLFNTRLHDRLGETQYTDALTGEQKVTSLWMRHIGGHNRFRDGSGQISTQSNRYVMQLGGDIAQWSTDGLDRWHLGLMAGYANSKSRSRSSLTGYTSRGEISGYSAGLYGTWYANDADKTGAYVDGWMLYNWFDNSVSGQGLASEKYDSDGITASLEAGYTFRLTESSNGRDSYWLQPKVQVTWM
ncbi:autotransporter outer membrane beta-barrel domain-containing protein, partial [Citrobacter sp. ku-bf4]|uniref:autotransporter outer membrane beta-barrel domain-containing protein n=1 Tax=Citrobacter TaxID=544 RepID=UPI00197FE4C0